jgi:hypothetical protein
MLSARSRLLGSTAAAAMLLALPSSPLAAQDVQYETVTSLELPGVLGTAMRVAARLGGGSTTTTETTYIKGGKMRTDSDDGSIIIDLENRRWTELDHGARTYRSMTFDEALAEARRAMREAADGAAAERTDGGGDDIRGNVSFRLSVEDGAQRERIAGYQADRFYLVMEAEGEYVPEGETEMERGGTLVVLTDLWSSRDVPAHAALGRFQEVAAREYADASAALMEGLAAAFAEDPQLRVAFEQSIDQIRDMDGMPMRTTTTFVYVAPDHTFDRELALGERRGPSAAQQAGRAALRGLAGRMAGRGQQQAEPERTQMTLMKVTSEIRDVQTRTLDPSLFEVPAGYSPARDG